MTRTRLTLAATILAGLTLTITPAHAQTDRYWAGTGTLGFSDFAFTDLGGVEAGAYVLISSTGGIIGSLDPADRNGTIGSLTSTLQINGNTLEWATDADLATWTKDAGAIQSPTPDMPVEEVETVSVTLTATPVGGKLFAQVRAME